MNYRAKSTLVCYGVVLPSMVMLLTFVYLPVVWAFSKSFYAFEIGGESRFVGLDNYAEYLAEDPTCYPSLVNMAILTLIAVAARLTFPLIAAKLIHSLPRERWRYFYRLVFLVPIVVPGVAVQLIWAGMIYSDSGLVNEFLRAIGDTHLTRGWLSDPRTALISVAMVGFPFVSAFEVLVYYAGLSNIPTSLHEASAIDGCTGVRKFFAIDIPLILGQIKLIVILTIIGSVQGFQSLIILTRGGPGFKTTVPGLWMYFNAFSFQRMGYASAIGVLMFLLILALTVLNLKYFRGSEAMQGVE